MAQTGLRRIRTYLKVLIALYETRTQSGLTYDDISDATGISTNTLSRMANNQQRRMDFSVLERLCDFFGCELHDLIHLEPPANEES